MSIEIRFEELTLSGSDGDRTVRFVHEITPVIGPVGTGKTSLLELLKYALGGDGTLSQTVVHHVDHVVLQVHFASGPVRFARRIGANTLDAFDAGDEFIETLAAGRSKRHRSVSAFLLEVAGLPPLTISSRQRTESLSFFDVYRYCYLPQSEIDRSVVRHDDSILARRRKAAFEMLFGLSDVETSAAARAVAEAERDLAAARGEEAAVRRFLDAASMGTERELRGELSVTEAEAERARSELAQLRSSLRAATTDEASRQQVVAEMAARLRELHEEALSIQARLRQHATVLAQYELDLERLGRSTAARHVLDAIEFSRCPRCLQSVVDRPVPEGRCVVCTQPDPPKRTLSAFAAGAPSGQLGFGDVAISDERRRIEALRGEVLALASDDEEALQAVFGRQRAEEAVLRERLSDLDRRTREYVSPRYEAIAELSAIATAAESKTREIQTALQYWSRFGTIARHVVDLGSELERRKTLLADARAALEARRAVVAELSDEFDEQIRQMEPPWYQGASVDVNTYLPNLNGAKFETLSGGEKTMVNVAYHLALLAVAMRHPHVLLPALLVIDTPRKNLGAGYDQAYAQRIYRRIETLADAYSGRFQLIIADNDTPPIPLPNSSEVTLSYDAPLVPGVAHPGPGVETLVTS